MRFLLDENGSAQGMHDIITIEGISVIPCWKTDSEKDSIPDVLEVHIEEVYDHVLKTYPVLTGHYDLDDTLESYKAAIANYNKICEQLLVSGYARMSDFENFIWTDI